MYGWGVDLCAETRGVEEALDATARCEEDTAWGPDTTGSSRTDFIRWQGGVVGRWPEVSDLGFATVGTRVRVASAFACFAFDTAKANGAGVGDV